MAVLTERFRPISVPPEVEDPLQRESSMVRQINNHLSTLNRYMRTIVGENRAPHRIETSLADVLTGVPGPGGPTGPRGAVGPPGPTGVTTTKGDLITHNGTTEVRLPVGANGLVLTANSAVGLGVEWAAVPANTLQASYDVSVQPQIVLDNTRNGVQIRDALVPIGVPLYSVTRNDGTNPFLEVSAAQVDIGCMGASPALKVMIEGTKSTVKILDDDITDTVAPAFTGFLTWDSTYTADFANATFGGLFHAIGTVVFEQSANPVNMMNLFVNQATIKNATGVAANFGSAFTAIDQPRYQSDNSAGLTMLQHNGFRSFPTFEGIGTGTLSCTTSTSLIAGCVVNAGATVTNRRVVHVFNPTGAGAITNNIGMDIENQTMGSNIFGIRSAMTAGFFISHTGTAPSQFSGEIRINDDQFLTMGTDSNTSLVWDETNQSTRAHLIWGLSNGDPTESSRLLLTTKQRMGLDFALAPFGAPNLTIHDGSATVTNYLQIFHNGSQATFSSNAGNWAAAAAAGATFFYQIGPTIHSSLSVAGGFNLRDSKTFYGTIAVDGDANFDASSNASNLGNLNMLRPIELVDIDATPVANRRLQVIDGFILATNTSNVEGEFISSGSIQQGTGSGLDADLLDGIQAAEFIQRNGTVPLTADWDAGSNRITAETFTSDVAIGTAPLTVTSTTVVANLTIEAIEESGGQRLTMGAVADNQVLQRSGTTIIGVAGGGGGDTGSYAMRFCGGTVVNRFYSNGGLSNAGVSVAQDLFSEHISPGSIDLTDIAITATTGDATTVIGIFVANVFSLDTTMTAAMPQDSVAITDVASVDDEIGMDFDSGTSPGNCSILLHAKDQ